MRINLLVFFLLATVSLAAQSKAPLQPAAMKQDLAYLRNYLEATHPGLYKHHTREAMQVKMDSLAQTLDRPLPFLEFYKKIAYLIAEVRCEHTTCGYGEGYEKFVQSAGFFPLQLYFMANRAYVLVNLSNDTTVHLGDELLSINNYPIDSIRQVLHQYIPSDGYMTVSKDQQLSGMAFNVWYYLFIEQPAEFNISLRTVSGKIINKKWKALTLKKINGQAVKNPVNRAILEVDARLKEWRKQPLRLEMMPGKHAAVMTVQSFSLDPEKFRPTIDSFFNVLSTENTQKLIIDLSNNGGGDNELAAELASYFITGPTSMVEYSYLITDSDDHLKLSNIPDEVIKAKYDYIEPLKDGRSYAKLTKYSGELKTIRPQLNRFSGKVYLFVNGGTSSAASTITAFLKSEGLVTVVGEETAGCYEGGGTTNGLDLTLPNSKITAHISIVYQRFRTKGGDPHRGVMPDVPYILSLEELISGEKNWRDFIFRLN